MTRHNPYLPLRIQVTEVAFETEDRTIKTLRCAFTDESFAYTCGQFAELLAPGVGEAPFGMASSPLENGLAFTISKAGIVSSALHDLEAGAVIGVRGPLGNGYPMAALEGKNLLLIGGGFGFTTLRSLASFVLDPKNRDRFGRLTVVYGARGPGMLLYDAELELWSGRSDIDLHLTIDRPAAGWDKHVGFVPAVTARLAPDPHNTFAIVCGPPVMIKHTLPVLETCGFGPERVLLSLEMKMKCGIGQCGRCNIGDHYVCTDGPVFSRAQISRLTEDL